MTDDESRKAFEEFSKGMVGIALSPDDGEGRYEFGRDDLRYAIQWATKRERERFIKQLIDAVDDKDLNTKISTRAIISLVIASNTQAELE